MTKGLRDEQLIRDVEEAYDRAWQAGDIDGLLACLTKDAVVVNPFGGVARGHTEIREMLASFIEGPAKDSTHVTSISRVSFLGSDVAVVDGSARIERPGPAGSVVEHGFTDVVLRSGDSWRIAHVRAYAFIDKRESA